MIQICRTDLTDDIAFEVFVHFVKDRWNISNLEVFRCGTAGGILLWVDSKQFYGPFANEQECREWIKRNVY